MEKGFEIFKFKHFRFPDISPSAGVTVAICEEPKRLSHWKDVHEGSVAAVAFCDPNEKNFSRSEGRKIAVRKLTDPSTRHHHVVYSHSQFAICNTTSLDEIARYVLNTIPKPKWYREGVGNSDGNQI